MVLLPNQFNASRLQLAFDRVKENVQKGKLHCGVLAVANSRETVRCEAFTRADGDQVKIDSVFLLASITKPIVATAIMQLVERGLLVLGVPLAHYIPEFAQPGKLPVSAWNLLTHTSGMEQEGWFTALVEAQVPPSAHVRAACRSSLRFPPGTRYEYCTLSFYVLGELITRLSGMPYPEYLHKRIFEALGMKDTSFDPGPTRQDRAAPVHGDIHGGESLGYFKTTLDPGSGLWSTAADLIAFGQTYLNRGIRGDHRLLSPLTIGWMTRNHVSGLTQLIEGRPQPAYYGLGWGKTTLYNMLPGSPRVYDHGGATGTLLWIDPDYDLIYVFLTNEWGMDWNTNPIQHSALQAVYGALESS
jgi:CubicO group peptidase (beta-lactamase class C family)